MTNPSGRKTVLARKLRKTMTEPERLLWARLKTRDQGIVFKRQHPIGPYILDFFCHKARLAIEVDGAQHGVDAAQIRDATRDSYFRSLDIETYRVPAAEVYRNADEVADGILLLAESILASKR